ncbi:MAG: START-like domain-containing protein [Bacteroidota bacterium]
MMKTQSLQKFTLEYSFNASPRMLYAMLGTYDGLNVWFADKVTLVKNVFHFFWNNTEYTAEITQKKEFELLHYTWIDGESDKYFEFRIKTDSLNNETTLLITDFAFEDDRKEAEMSWDYSIKKLLRAMGSKLSSINT